MQTGALAPLLSEAKGGAWDLPVPAKAAVHRGKHAHEIEMSKRVPEEGWPAFLRTQRLLRRQPLHRSLHAARSQARGHAGTERQEIRRWRPDQAGVYAYLRRASGSTEQPSGLRLHGRQNAGVACLQPESIRLRSVRLVRLRSGPLVHRHHTPEIPWYGYRFSRNRSRQNKTSDSVADTALASSRAHFGSLG